MSEIKQKIIARFPPSPTGWFHIGNARTALFNYFFIKKNGGELLFRLEDTDKERSKKEYEQDIIKGLKWLGININFDKIYKQSEHSVLYKKYLEKMIADGKAYISKEEIKEEGQKTEVIRLKNPGEKIVFEDMIRGEIIIDTTELGDFIIAKSLDEPIYHFAVVIDDFEMGITHIIRGEDGIYNTPRQILIQQAIGAPRPKYAHTPFILNEDRTKLSKRKQGEFVSLKYYREQGYLPEAMINFLAMCGWNPGDDTEIMSMEEIIEKFDIIKVQKGGAIFNQQKLLWFNKEYLKLLPKEKIIEEIKKRFPENCQDIKIIKKISDIIIERINVFSDIDKMVVDGDIQYFFKAGWISDIQLDDQSQKLFKEMIVWKKDGTLEQAKENLILVLNILKDANECGFETQINMDRTQMNADNKEFKNLKEKLMKLAEEKGKGNVLWPLRVALSGKEKSPDPFTLLFILGKEESMERIQKVISL
ncbi:MAG: glutamate--tRNA ligase family protein [bacterium]